MSDHPKSSPTELFDRTMADAYDQRNSRLAAISNGLHFLLRLVLDGLPDRARILCVGIGTGAEILALAEAHADWSFVGVDPSPDMLAVCRERLERAGVLDRCELIRGYADDVPAGAGFDAAVAILVAHFVPASERLAFYRGIRDRITPGGHFVSAEISCDLDSAEFPQLLRNWERVQTLMGATPESLRTLPDTLRRSLSILPPTRTEALLKECGYALPVQFFQAFLIRGWYAVK